MRSPTKDANVAQCSKCGRKNRLPWVDDALAS